MSASVSTADATHPATSLTLPIDIASIDPARKFVEEWSAKAGLEGRLLQRFVFAATEVVEAVVVLARERKVKGQMALQAWPVEGWITIDISFPAQLPLEPVFELGEGPLEQLPGKNLAPELFWRHVIAEWVDRASWHQQRHTKTISLTQYARQGGNPAQLYFLGLKPKSLEDLALYEVDGSVVAASPKLRSAFRLTPQAAFILRMADGTKSVREIYRAYLDRFGLVHPRVLGAMVEDLTAKGLMSLGRPLVSKKRESSGWRRLLARLLAMQYSVPHPDRLVERAARWIGWAYGPRAGLAWAAFVAVSIPLIWGDAQVAVGFASRLQRMWAELGGWGVAGVVVLLNLHILLHELSHCIVCKRLGGRIHALGVVFYYGMVCPFADTTEAWGFANRWHRAMVSLAGVMCDLVGACTYGWAHLGALAMGWKGLAGLFGVMSGIIFYSGMINLMPLLETDGYYALSDILDMPNLRKRSWEYLKALILRRPSPEGPKWVYVIFGLCSLAGVAALFVPPLLVISHAEQPLTGMGLVMAEMFVAIMALRVVKWALEWYRHLRGQHIILKNPGSISGG